MKKSIDPLKKLLPFIFALLTVCLFGCQKQETLKTKMQSGHFLTIENAISEVETFLKEVEPINTRSYGEGRKIASSWTKSLTEGKESSQDYSPELYILNFEDSLGFAIVSNDSRKGVLGLALLGSYEKDKPVDNPGFAIIMENLEAYAKMPMRVDSIDHYEYGSWEDTYYVPNTGYCTVRWSQGTSSGNQYNAYCPTINGIYCPAGCGPVAVAQLMSMYKYPSSYGAYSFNWDSMIANSSATDNYGDYYVGRLLQQLGLSQNLNVTYGINSSGFSGSSIPHTFENFGYADGGTYGTFYSYNAIQDLKNGYPIIITGKTSSNIGHSWLSHGVYDRTRECIGYNADGVIVYYGQETEEFVLHNFGWGGWGNGYYWLNNYDTTQGPTYYDPIYPYYSTGSYNFVSEINSVYGIRRY